MANRKNGLGKVNLLSSTSLTRQVAVIGSLGLVFGASSAFALDPNALPQDPNVVGGHATFNQAGSTLNVNQSTNRTVIDWRSFDIGSNATTNFVQPGASSIAVNRVNSSANPTQIQGNLNANGQVWILNPNGVMFGKTAKVDVAGIVASTANIDARAFMAGDNRLQMSGADHGEVSNAGTVTVADGGLAAFVAPSVRNSGVINARLGKVTLAAGTTYTLDLAGDRLVEIGLGAENAVVDQSGQVLADGSRVTLTAKAASAVVDSVVNVSGTVLASGVHEEGGSIVLTADNVTTTSSAVLKADAGTNGDGGTIYGYADKLGKYDGTFSAKGGSASGNGGFIETSGKKVQIANGISIDTRAANGETGNWTIDPDDLTVTDDSTIGGPIDPNASTVTNATIVDQLLTTSVTLAANNSITVDGAINSSGAGNLALNDQNADNDLTINLNAKITLGAGKTLSGQGTVVNVTDGASIQNGVDVAKTGADVNVAAGTFDAGANINKQGLTLTGVNGTVINVAPTGNQQINGLTIQADDVTVQGFKIVGEITGSYLDYVFGDAISRGIAVANGVDNFTIKNNNISNVRNGLLIDGRNGGVNTVTGNTIDNTKGAVSLQYTDAGVGNTEGYALDLSGNSEGGYGNEWGVNVHLNGHEVTPGGSIIGTKIAAEATSAVQQALLDNSAANGGWSVQDQGYSYSNRTSVYVDTAGSASNQGSQRAALNSINDGIKAVVTGGTVHVNDGTYVIASGGANYISIGKSLNLIGESEAGTIIDARNASTYGLRVIEGADGVSLSNFTLWGSTIGQVGKTDGSGNLGYGIKVERVDDFSISNVTSQGAFKSELDLNGVFGATIDNVTANGAPVGGGANTGGNGITITDSQDVNITNSNTLNNNWGGIAIYQSNRLSSGGYTYQTKDITVADSNTYAEANAVYTEDESATNDFGTLNIAGFDYIARNTNAADAYTWFQKTQQGAIDAAVLASGYVQGWLGSAASDVFTVGYNTAGDTALSINAAITAATTGATINVLSGTYNQAVTIGKGLTLAGAGIDDTTLTGGIKLNGAFSDLTFRDFTVSGDGGGNAIVRGGSTLTNFTADHVRFDGGDVAGRHGFASGLYSGDIAITDSEFVNIRGWSAFDTNTSGAATAITSVVFTGNLLDNTVGNVTFRQATPTANVTISDNIVRNVGDTTDLSSGIFKVFGAATVDFSNNDISGIGASPTKFTAGIADGAALIVRDVTTLNLTDNTFTDNQQALLVGAGNALPTTINVTGNTFTNNAYDIQLAGAVGTGTLNFGAGNNFVSGAKTQQHLLWGGSSDVDMTNVEFDGKLGSEMTQAELFALEDLITHGTDVASSGLVTVKDGNVYVTANSGSIQRGVNNAATGDTVNVGGGTYGAFGTSFGGASDVTIQTADGAIIDGTGLTGRIVDLRADGTTLTGFTIDGDGTGVGVSVSGQNVKVINNTISDTLTGVQTTTQYSAGNATISGNTINAAYGISLQNTGNTVSNNNVTASAEGVGLLKSSNTFTGNTFDIVNAGGHALQYYGTASANDLSASDNTVSISGGSLQGAVDLAGTDGNLNLAAGSYGLISTLNIKNDGLTLTGAGEAQSSISTIATGYGIDVTGDGVTLSGFTLNGPASGLYGIKVQPDTGVASDRLLNFAINHVTIDGAKKTGLDLNGVNGATIDHVTVTNTSNGNGIALTDSANVTITNSSTSGNAWGGLALYQSNDWYDQQTNNISVNTTNSFGEANPVYMEDQSASTDFGSVNIAGYTLAGHNVNTADKYTWLNNSVTGLADWMQTKGELLTGYITGWTGSASDNTFQVGHATDGTAMSINAAVANSAAGNTINVGSGTYGENVVVTGARNVVFNGSTLSSYTQNVASAIGGTVTAAGGFVLNGLTTLLSNTVLNGAVTADAIDGGTHTLAVNGGATVLNGGSYKAASLNFNGTSTTLTAANTAFNTAANNGDITFTGPIFGTTDGAQSLSFNAGTAGDISLQNAGTNAVWLGDMTVNGHDFSAATVYVNSFTSQLTGNQTFTDETLNTKGGVQSNVGGNASGPINAGGNVDVTAGGAFNGNVTGNVMNVSGQTVTGTFTGSTLTLSSTNGVNVTTNVGTLVLNTPSGTVNGTFTTLVNNGGTVVVNGQTRTGDVGTNPNQIIVEGFTLPAGAFVTASGEIVLPSGLLIGLVSPAAGPGAEGGKPKVIIVHSVRKLGELLAQGYAAIIVDLNKDSDEEEIVAMN